MALDLSKIEAGNGRDPRLACLMSTAQPSWVEPERRAMTESQQNCESSVVMSSTTPSTNCCCSGSREIFTKGRTAIVGLPGKSQHCAVPAHDDLRECRAKDTLTRCGGCSGMRPGALQISTERHQLLALRPAERRRTTRNQGGDLSFDPCDSLQCLVPAALQLAGDQPVCRVDGDVLSARVRGFVARLLLRQLQLALAAGDRIVKEKGWKPLGEAGLAQTDSNLALVWNVRTWPAMAREKAQAAPTARPKVLMRRRGADCP